MKKNEGLSEQVYNYLLSQILSDELKPGEKIAEENKEEKKVEQKLRLHKNLIPAEHLYERLCEN